jgi:hypothetical protein
MRQAPPAQGASDWTIDQLSVMHDVEYNAGLEDAQGVITQLMQNPDQTKALHNAPLTK